MKVILEGQMDVVRREASPNSSKSSVVLSEIHGKVVEGHKGPDNIEATASVQLLVKPLILAQIPIGAPLYVIVTDQKPEGWQ